MQKYRLVAYVFLVVYAVIFILSQYAHADEIHLRLPTFKDGSHAFYHDLLRTSLTKAGHTVTIMDIPNLPHLRVRQMLETGGITLFWLIRTAERDELYIPTNVSLTEGMIGRRILLVHPHNQDLYKDVHDLGEFRRMGTVGVFGSGWFDVSVWNENHLPYRAVADWSLLYRLVAVKAPEADYFSRGFNEIVAEQEAHPYLVLEKHIMFEYDRDQVFYLSPDNPELAPVIEEALRKASASGLIQRLVRKHWARNFTIIKPEMRTVIRLKLPQ